MCRRPGVGLVGERGREIATGRYFRQRRRQVLGLGAGNGLVGRQIDDLAGNFPVDSECAIDMWRRNRLPSPNECAASDLAARQAAASGLSIGACHRTNIYAQPPGKIAMGGKPVARMQHAAGYILGQGVRDGDVSRSGPIADMRMPLVRNAILRFAYCRLIPSLTAVPVVRQCAKMVSNCMHTRYKLSRLFDFRPFLADTLQPMNNLP